MPSAYKSKGKGRDARPPRSRNTTPSNAGGTTAVAAPPLPGYLENDVTKLIDLANDQYTDVLDLVAGPNIPDSKTLESLVEYLKSLSDMADARGETCNAGMREMSQKRKEVMEDQEISREVSERAKLKRETEDDDDLVHKAKLKKRKERSSTKEERPLNHGAHDVARQDGAETKVEGAASPVSKHAKNAASDGSSSLSPPSMLSPNGAAVGADGAAAPGSPDSESSEDSHQPEPQPAVPQIQVFGDNPLKFDDPTVYHIRDVTPDMGDDEKKEIYSVASFPKSDLAHMMAGVPPDKDFSNAKPSNQVGANTFLTWIEPYVRPLTEEDIAWLKERGDRTNPFIIPRRGKKNYRQIWAEEDGVSYDPNQDDKDQLPLNQGRGNIDQLTDDKTETNEVSIGPLLSRLVSLLRYEHRTLPEDSNSSTNGDLPAAEGLNGDAMELDQPNGNLETKPSSENKSLPAATSFRDASPTGFKTSVAKLDHAQLDERAKAELRYIGFLGADDNPDYDAHYDDEVAERLRLLQGELKKQIITNNARKARILKIAQEHMALLEFTTIQDDLDSQVQQAYLKRTRTMGKSKKGSQAKHRPGGAGSGVAGAGVSRPAVGDAAKIVMDRRKRWNEAFLPIFEDIKTTIPSENETIFDPAIMAEYEKAELEAWDEE
ncbi:transcriptional regulator Ngg1 [Penicillium brasilianum]|uniref:Transcriptional regulator Ngg1 n=1 Tax=Penicillium brasilianum TaxID=104259 RepID=A0A1S9RLE1_PENBI|nr:transcriptional regulator Ngg1 [Penicillium brasilianum]